MSTANRRIFGVRETANGAPSIDGFTRKGHMYIANELDAGSPPDGYDPEQPGVSWYMGPIEGANENLIAYTQLSGGVATLFNSTPSGDGATAGPANTARIAFKRFEDNLGEAEFCALAESISGSETFENSYEATDWLSDNSCWTNYVTNPQLAFFHTNWKYTVGRVCDSDILYVFRVKASDATDLTNMYTLSNSTVFQVDNRYSSVTNYTTEAAATLQPGLGGVIVFDTRAEAEAAGGLGPNSPGVSNPIEAVLLPQTGECGGAAV